MKKTLVLLGAAALLAATSHSVGAAEPTPAEIAGKMADVADELNRQETGEPVQTEQKAIIRDLDALIAALEKQNQNLRAGVKRNRPMRGMADSMISAGTGGIGTLGNPSDNGPDWGKLSSRERDRIMQSMSEGFPPEYRTVLERYYRRLAEEKKAGPSEGGSSKPKASADRAGTDEKP